jgi:hypothetical protein
MHLSRLIVPTLAAAALCAGEAGPAPVTLRVADGPALVKAWDASIYAKVWADPAAAPLRAKWAESLKAAQAELGFDPVAAIQGLTGFEARFLGMAGEDQPRLHLRVDLGAAAAPIFARISKDGKGAAKQVAGADEAFGDADGTIARFGTVLVVAVHTDPVATAPAGAATAAVALDLDAKRLVDAIAPGFPAEKKADFDKIVKNLAPYLGLWKYRGDIVSEGIRERLDANVATPGMMPVDRSVLARLPATTLLALSYGFDGKAYWKAAGDSMLLQLDEAMHPGAAIGGPATAQEIQGVMQAMGIDASLQQVIEGLSGTSLFAVTQAAPFPAVTIALPRSKPLDQLLGIGLAQIGGTLPEEGQSSPVVVPGLPIPVAITLLRDKAHWVLTTDPMLVATWSSGAPGGFADTTMAKTLYAAAPKDSALLGAADTPAVLRTIQGYLGLGLAGNKDLTAEQKQAISGAIIRLAAAASTGYVFSANDAKGSHSEVRGLIGSGVVPVLVGAATAWLMMKPQMGDGMALDMGEAKAATPDANAIEALGSMLFPAQFQFQGGAYADQDGDGIGEYATLSELMGKRPAPGRVQAEQLAEGFADDGTRDGYRFTVFLPDAKGGALAGEGGRKADKAAADAQERAFVIYAWPVEAAGGARAFAVDQTGVVYEAPYTGKAPAWNELYSGQGWDGVPAWQPAQR